MQSHTMSANTPATIRDAADEFLELLRVQARLRYESAQLQGERAELLLGQTLLHPDNPELLRQSADLFRESTELFCESAELWKQAADLTSHNTLLEQALTRPDLLIFLHEREAMLTSSMACGLQAKRPS